MRAALAAHKRLSPMISRLDLAIDRRRAYQDSHSSSSPGNKSIRIPRSEEAMPGTVATRSWCAFNSRLHLHV